MASSGAEVISGAIHIDPPARRFERARHDKRRPPRVASARAREQTVLALFRRGACSAGVAAELLGRTYLEYLDFLKERGVDYAPGDTGDKAADDATLRWMSGQATDDDKPT
jgi:predicted HTH domain antitoxin